MSASPAAKAGDTVQVHYTGTLTDGSEFDSSLGSEPLEVTLGEGRLIRGFEDAVLGMSVGESKQVTIPCAEAYGKHNPQMAQQVPRDLIPAEIDLAEGMTLHAQGPEGQTLRFTVVSFDDEAVAIDGNHPLAGEDLTFDVELMAIL
jgi:peptidylprolyl isomerase